VNSLKINQIKISRMTFKKKLDYCLIFSNINSNFIFYIIIIKSFFYKKHIPSTTWEFDQGLTFELQNDNPLPLPLSSNHFI
jgi:hypothetical protein